VPPARSRHALAPLGQREVILRPAEARHQRQRVSVEQATPAAGVGRRGKPTGQTPPAQHLLDEGDADAELAGESAARGRPFVAGRGHLGTYIRGGGFHAKMLRRHRSTTN
jgi:hypothetical protein